MGVYGSGRCLGVCPTEFVDAFPNHLLVIRRKRNYPDVLCNYGWVFAGHYTRIFKRMGPE